MIDLENICKYYGEDEYKQEVLKQVSLKVGSGKMAAIMGPSGSGKSTLLNIIGLLDSEFEGKYRIDDKDASKLSTKEKAALRSDDIGFVFQSFQLLRELTALENVQMGLVIANTHRRRGTKFGRNEIKKRSKDILIRMGLEKHMLQKVFQLSGGQQQRVAIARALINDPQVILADEPTGALDQKTGREIMEIFRELNQMGKTIVIVTHDEKIASYCEQRFYIVDGELKRE